MDESDYIINITFYEQNDTKTRSSLKSLTNILLIYFLYLFLSFIVSY